MLFRLRDLRSPEQLLELIDHDRQPDLGRACELVRLGDLGKTLAYRQRRLAGRRLQQVDQRIPVV